MEYRLINIPKPIWDQFRKKCIDENLKMRQAILNLIEKWIKEKNS